MRTLILTIILSLNLYQVMSGQIANIKNEILELFFEIPLDASKFQVRKILNESEIIFDIEDIEIPNASYSIISAAFKNNYKLGNLRDIDKMHTNFYFSNADSKPFYRGLTFTYNKNDYNKELKDKLLLELVGFFKPYSKMIKKPFFDNNSILTGDKYFFYSSQLSLKEDKPFLKIDSFTLNNEIVVIVNFDRPNLY